MAPIAGAVPSSVTFCRFGSFEHLVQTQVLYLDRELSKTVCLQ
jgi:hypothetical protein